MTSLADALYGDTPTTFAEFVEGADRHYHMVRATTEYYRIGQAYFNYFATHFPEHSARIVATGRDPFCRESALGEFLAYVRECGAVSA